MVPFANTLLLSYCSNTRLAVSQVGNLLIHPKNVPVESFAMITAPGILPDFTADMNADSMTEIMFCSAVAQLLTGIFPIVLLGY